MAMAMVMAMQSETVLLVEDNPDDVAFTRRAFRKNDFDHHLVVAHDGEEALALLLPSADEEPLRPAVALVDINLPRISGLDLVARLRAHPRTRLLPVIMLTTSVEHRDVLESYRIGANSYVRKPVQFDDFIEVIRSLGQYWFGVNQGPPVRAD